MRGPGVPLLQTLSRASGLVLLDEQLPSWKILSLSEAKAPHDNPPSHGLCCLPHSGQQEAMLSSENQCEEAEDPVFMKYNLNSSVNPVRVRA